MTFEFHPEADQEFIQAAAYYEECSPGLGMDFFREVSVSIRNAVEYPTMWPEIEGGIRRCLVHRFPYGILFSIESDRIYLLAIMHLRRNPGYWKDRV